MPKKKESLKQKRKPTKKRRANLKEKIQEKKR